MTTNPGTALVSLRKKVTHTCPVCRELFVGYPCAITCGDRCRTIKNRAARAAKADKESKAKR
jgi:hypothetical protein